MADTLTTTTQIDSAVNNYYDRKLLVKARPYQIHSLFGQARNLPAKSSNTIKFRRYTKLSTAAIALAEGIEPNGQRLAKTDVPATVRQYGDYVHSTDIVDLTVEDNVLNETADLLAIQYGETIDELTRDVLIAGSTNRNCAGGSNGQTPTEITTADVAALTKTLRTNSARFTAPMITARTGQGTAPVRQSFWAMANTFLEDDLEDCMGFRSVANYSGQQTVLESEWGNIKNVRFLTSPLAEPGTSADADSTYKIPLIGRDAYGIIRLKRGDVKWIYHEPKIAGGALEQYWTAGWKTMYVAKILNDNFMGRLTCTHSDHS